MVPSHSLENLVLEVLMGSDDLYKRKRELKEFKRRVGTRGKDRDLILIVCEGEKTEPYYFKGFRLTNVTVIGTGFNTQSLVERAYDLKTQAIVDKDDTIRFGVYSIEILLILRVLIMHSF